MTISPLKILFALIMWALLTLAALGVFVWQWLHTEHAAFDNDITYVVESGSSLNLVAKDLSANGVIRWPKVWVLYARIFNLASIRAGEYRLNKNASPVSILRSIHQGTVVQHQITLVEGLRFSDFLSEIHSKDNVVKTLTGMNALAGMLEVDIPINHLEGWFYPDTYQFAAGDSDLSILQRSYKKMTFVLAEEWLGRDDGLPYKNAYEALIMASIIEKETGAGHERPQIAGVFVRRLRKGMRLQTDPTVIYGMGDSYRGNIRRKDLRIPTPYNTYVINGLPPTPIAMPGRKAIHAALHPESGDTLYFVAKGDGTHYFSKTITEHNNAVRKFQKKRRSDYRSSPAAVSSGEG